MGWLKDTQAQAPHARNSPDVDFFDTLSKADAADYLKQLDDRSSQDWHSHCKKLEDECLAAYQMAQQAIREITERDSAKPRASRKPYLNSYDEYKRIAVSRWMTFLAERAINAELAIEFGFCKKPPSNEAIAAGFYKTAKKEPCLQSGIRRVRVVKSGAKGKSGASRQMPVERISVGTSAVRKHNWHRRGSINFLWPLNPLMNSDKFEAWAKDAAQMTLDEFLQREKEMDRAAYE